MGLFGKKTKTGGSANTATPEELFLQGKAIEQTDPNRAFQLFLASAQGSYPDAMNKVGYAYLYQGMGAEFDVRKSAYWFDQGARRGQPGCMLLISQFYMSGVGVEENDEAAKYWLQMGVQSGNEKLAKVAQGRLDDYANTKIVVTAVMENAVKFNGIPR